MDQTERWKEFESEPLTAICLLTAYIATMERARRDLVAVAREQGARWGAIGHAVGTSTQGAWEKYRSPGQEQAPDGREETSASRK